MKAVSVVRALVKEIAARTGIIVKGPDSERRMTQPWLRSLCRDLFDKKAAKCSEIADILDIPLQTVVNFKAANEQLTPLSQKKKTLLWKLGIAHQE